MATSSTGDGTHPTALMTKLMRGMGFIWPSVRSVRTAAAGAPLNQAAMDMSGQYALTSAAVWRCCQIIANAIATLPAQLYEDTGEGKVKAFDHPLYRTLVISPNPAMALFQWLQPTILHLLLWGNAFTRIVRNGQGEVLALWPLQPYEVRCEYNSSRTLDYYYPRDSPTPLGTDDLLHFRLFTLDGLIGLSVIQYQRANLVFEHLSQDYASSIYENGGERPTGILKFRNPMKEEQINRIREYWAARHSSPGRVAVLDNGAEYEAISAPLSDLDFLSQAQYSIEQIARMFGVPLHLLDAAQKPTYASVEQDSIEFRTYTLSPITVCIEKGVGQGLLLPPYYYKLNLNAFERSDFKTRMDGYGVARQWGWMSANDIRALEDMNSIGPDGDIYLQPSNMVPAGTVVSTRNTFSGG